MRKPLKKKRNELSADLIYNSEKITMFINYVMLNGKKSVAEKIVYDCLTEIKKRTERDEMEILEEAIANSGPSVELKTKRVGGANYQIPITVSSKRKLTLFMRWTIQNCRKKFGKPMNLRLADSIIASSKKEGEIFTKRENTYKMAEANKAFAHFAK